MAFNYIVEIGWEGRHEAIVLALLVILCKSCDEAGGGLAQSAFVNSHA